MSEQCLRGTEGALIGIEGSIFVLATVGVLLPPVGLAELVVAGMLVGIGTVGLVGSGYLFYKTCVD